MENNVVLRLCTDHRNPQIVKQRMPLWQRWFTTFLLLGLLMLLPMAAHAQRKMYGRLNTTDGTLTLYYDENKQDGDYNIPRGNQYDAPDWETLSGSDERTESINRVVFDPSFKDARPTTTYSWFSRCKNLEQIQGIEHLNTSEVTNMNGMFHNCEKLTTIDLSNFNTEKVTNMYGMFYGCKGLKEIDLHSFDTQNVVTFGSMFSGCEGLTTLHLASFETRQANNMSEMFKDCAKLSSIDLSQFNTSSVTDMNRMFAGCKSLEHLNLSGFNVEKVKDMSYMFSACSKLTSIDLSNFNPQSLENMMYMFYLCDAVTSIKLPNSDMGNLKQMQGLFQNCKRLTDIQGLEHLNTSQVTNMDNVFSYCESLTAIDLSHFNTENVSSMYDMFQFCTSLKQLNLSSFDTRKVTNFGYMFYNCVGLTSLEFPPSFITESATYMSGMFQYCESLTDIKLGNFNTSNVTDMSYMFYGCKSLQDLDLSSFNVEKVENMQAMFAECSKLTSIDLSRFNTKSLSSMPIMFSGCKALTHIDLSSFNTEKVGSLQSLFYQCTSLEKVDLSNFNTTNLGDTRYMFEGCTSLVSVDLSSFATEKLTSMDRMFSGCGKLQTIYASSAFTTDIVQWDGDAFKGCTSLPNYDPNKTGKELAHIGEGGYFTVAPAWVRFDEGTGTLTFHCSTAKSDAETDYDLNEGRQDPGWNSKASDIKTVVFTRSFRDVRPSTCSSWFLNCSNLSRIDGLENLNTSAATDMQYMFYGCKQLSSLDLSHFNTECVTNMGAMFKNCSGLTSLDISGFNTEKVTTMQDMFAGCSQLAALDLSSFKGSQVTSAANMFDGCTGLASVSLSQFDTPKLHYMGKMFYNCSALTALDLSSFDLKEMNFQRGVEGNQMFDYCSSLQTIYVGDNFELKYGSNMFRGCHNLRGAIAFADGEDEVDKANYVTGYLTKKVGTNGDDIVGAVGNPLTIETLVLDDSKAFVLKENCRVKNVSYTRPMENEWGTLCLPYVINVGSGESTCQFYNVSGVGENSVTLERFEVGQIAPGYPVIVRKQNKEQISITHIDNNLGTLLVTSPMSSYRLVGTFATTEVPEDGYFLAKDEFRLVKDYTQLEEVKGVKLAAFRAYLQPQASGKSASVLSIGMGGETNGVETPEVVELLNDPATEYYDMSGRRIPNLRKGINIIKRGDQIRKVTIR